jgi:hypothetical protein
MRSRSAGRKRSGWGTREGQSGSKSVFIDTRDNTRYQGADKDRKALTAFMD